jgi:hypothetical protein
MDAPMSSRQPLPCSARPGAGCGQGEGGPFRCRRSLEASHACAEKAGADDRAFFLKVRDVVQAAVSEATFLQTARKLQRTLGIRLTGDPVKAVEVLAQRYTLNDDERTGVLRHLIEDGELSGFGLVNAVTHYSQKVESYDRATEFEALGGRLLELTAPEWKGLAEAA